MYIKNYKNNPGSIYDWVVCSQNFIVNSFFNFENYIGFDPNDNKLNIRHPYHFDFNLNLIDAIAIHDNYGKNLYHKYYTKFRRMHDNLCDDKNKFIFIRLLTEKDNIANIVYDKCHKQEGFYYDETNLNLLQKSKLIKESTTNSFKNQEDILDKWIEFMERINIINKNCILILFSRSTNDINQITKNIFITQAYNWDQVNIIANK